MAKEWVKDARNKVRVEANFRVESSKALAVAKQKIQELNTKVITEERGRKSAETGLKNAQDQAGNEGRGVEVAKGKEAGQGKARPEDEEKGKEAKSLLETKGPKATPKVKKTTPKAADPHVSQLANKEDPPRANAQLRIFLFSLFFFCTFSFVVAVCHCLRCIFLLFNEKTSTFTL